MTAERLLAAGAQRLGVASDDYGACADQGHGCTDVFAVSLPGVTPSAHLTWFQAQQACKNARKRLPSNAEWQVAVSGTPDPGPDDGATLCNRLDPTAVATGSRNACVSARGAYDMVGNLDEWVADWVPRSLDFCVGEWSAAASPTGDWQCFVGVATSGPPGALLRGGNYFEGSPTQGRSR